MRLDPKILIWLIQISEYQIFAQFDLRKNTKLHILVYFDLLFSYYLIYIILVLYSRYYFICKKNQLIIFVENLTDRIAISIQYSLVLHYYHVQHYFIHTRLEAPLIILSNLLLKAAFDYTESLQRVTFHYCGGGVVIVELLSKTWWGHHYFHNFLYITFKITI